VENPSRNSGGTQNGLATLTFHGDLIDFLKKAHAEGCIAYPFTNLSTVKHIIETLGVPHPEVDRIERDGLLVSFNYEVQSGDDLHVYPFSAGSIKLSFNQIRFVLDNHLGKLTDYLRLLGFDAIYAQDWPDSLIAQCAAEENRILLTRDRGLLKRKIVTLGRCIRADEPIDQLNEVVDFFDIKQYISPFRRCPRCNGSLAPVPKQQILDNLQPLTRKYYDEFTRCGTCGQIYWKGSHYDKIQKMLAPFLSGSQEET